MKKSQLLGALCATFFSVLTLPTQAELIGVLPATSGGTDWQAYYDDEADLTWLADANASGGTMNWFAANAWAAGLNISGVTGWRLPSALNSDGSPCSGFGCSGSEMGTLYYNYNVVGAWVFFPSIQNFYWAKEYYAPIPEDEAWMFNFFNGHQGVADNYYRLHGWAVHDGDVRENPDADGDGVNDDEDLCPETAPEAAVDAVGCSDAQVDGDGDGVCNDGAVSNGPSTCVGADACPGTVIPEGVPTVRLGTNRWALVDDDFEFDTTALNGKDPDRSYSTADTGGCSCEQIIGALGLGTGQEKFGCSISTMDGWVALPR